MSRERVLVTGAFGFLGLALIRRLAAAHDVVAFGHAPRNPSARALIPEAVRIIEGELADAPVLVESERPTVVCHLAGGGGAAKCATDPVAAVRVNVEATIALAEAARTAGTRRLLFASTIVVYGAQRDWGRPYAEDDPARPDDLYGAVKLAGERAVEAIAGGTSLRLANLYGAGAGVDLGIQGAVERFARAAASGGAITTFGGGVQRIDYLHVDDAARGFERAIVPANLPPILNLGGGSPIAIGELARLCVEAGRALGHAPSVVDQPAPPGKSWPDRSLANERARELLGWTPTVSYDAGLAELVAMMARS
jgi:UDP-glucose 4-epimerase